MAILLGKWRATFSEMDLLLCSTWRELHCVNRIAMLLLVGLIVGGINGDGVDMYVQCFNIHINEALEVCKLVRACH